MMILDDRRKPDATRRFLWASLALNLFLIGTIAGSIAAGSTILHSFLGGSPPMIGPDNGPPLPVRMLSEVREKLSPEGKAIFDAEFAPVMEDLMKRRDDLKKFRELREVLLRDDATDAEIRGVFEKMKNGIGDDFGRILTHMANVAVQLSPEDRAELALHRPGPPPPPQ
ncbi:MAG: periplasmic heavy metal sensor [Thalassospira sp.]|nr:periplasmic heavy metal sensor [Thalassospira sp.]